MRRRILTILLAAVVVIVVVPLGAALTFDRRAPLRRDSVAAPVTATSFIQTNQPFPEAGALMLAGGLLIGLAAIVRRAG
jgi:hypothetical protein